MKSFPRWLAGVFLMLSTPFAQADVYRPAVGDYAKWNVVTVGVDGERQSLTLEFEAIGYDSRTKLYSIRETSMGRMEGETLDSVDVFERETVSTHDFDMPTDASFATCLKHGKRTHARIGRERIETCTEKKPRSGTLTYATFERGNVPFALVSSNIRLKYGNTRIEQHYELVEFRRGTL